MKLNTKTSFNFVAAAFLVSVFPGCSFIQYFKDKFSKKETSSLNAFAMTDHASGPVVMYIDGKPALNKSEFDERINRFVASQFQGAVSADNLPASFKKIIATKVLEQEVVLAWEKKHDAESKPDFIKNYEEFSKMLRAQLLFNEFEKEVVGSIHLTEAEVKGDYEKNKEKYVKTNGGTLAYAVEFDKEQSARDFLTKVKDKKDQFEELAKQEKGGTFKAFGRLNVNAPNNEIPASIKEAVVKYSGTYPALLLVSDNTHAWSLYLSDHKDTEFYAFDDIKGQIESMLRGQKAQEVYSKKIEDIKKELGVTVNEEALGINTSAAAEEATQMAMDQENGDSSLLESESAPVVA